MGTGQKVAIAGLVVLIGAVVTYYAVQEPADEQAIAIDTEQTGTLPEPTPVGPGGVGDPSMTVPDVQIDTDIGVRNLLDQTEPPLPAPPPVEPGPGEVDTLVQITETPEPDSDLAEGPGGEIEPDDEPVDAGDIGLGAPDNGADGVRVIDAVGEQPPFQTLTADDLRGSETPDSTVRINTGEVTEGDAAADSTAELEKYTVEDGDSMWIIARKTLGSGAKWELIAKANPMVDPLKIKKGDVLIIPRLPAERGPIAEKTPADPLGLGFNRDEKVIEVLEGDSLWRIAEREYGDGTKWQIIYSANQTRMKHENDLRVGQKLVIPPLPRE